MQRNVVETPLVDISSTEVRKRLAAGREVSGMISPKVLQYIREHRLYGIRDY
jgi:nicotinate-nucleotide adenylyltransferase